MRVIDADALRNILQNLGYDDWNQGVTTTWAEAFNEFADMVDETPTIEPEPHWIPCSERLPEEPIRVMAHLDNGWIITVYRQEEEWITVPDCGEPISDDEVIAWMPLPKAFREGEG